MANRKKKRPNAWQRVTGSIAKALRFSLKKRYLLWASVCVIVVSIAVKHVAVSHWLSGVDWVLVKDFLAVILTLPLAILVLGLTFMYKFSDPIREFLRKMDHFKAPGIEVSQQSASPSTPNDEKEQKTVEELESKVNDGSVTLTKQQVDELVSLIETMDFRFLSLQLVYNTKKALGLISQIEVKKSAFLLVYQVPPQVLDQVGERQAILNSLIGAQLIYEENDMLRVTAKGMRFLTFIGAPLQQAS